MSDITTAHRLGIPGVRTAAVRQQGEHRTLRVTIDDWRGFRAIEIHLTESEATQLAQQLTEVNQ